MAIVDFSLAGKNAIVTGGSKGIGRAIALTFAEHGADIAIAARGAAALESTRKEIEALGRRAIGIQADLLVDEDSDRIVRETVSVLGGVDILVNNAGTAIPGGVASTSQDQFIEVMKVNVWVPIRLSQLCRDSMIQRGGGTILHIASNEGLRPSGGMGIYAPSKAALINLTQLMAKEWAGDRIRVCCIAPGIVRTEMAEPLVKLIEATGVHLNPQRRIAEPGEVAGMALLLASPAGSFATGLTYTVDGGEVCTGPTDLLGG
jgi:NAD(P)-dependent dehydrogenase (short-subunit alcohol dehydrogenase family)